MISRRNIALVGLLWPMFSRLRSDSMVLSHMWFGLPGGRFQSDGGLRISAATAQ